MLYEHVPSIMALMALMAKINTALGDAGNIQSWFIGATESRVYCYGPSGDQLREKIRVAVADGELAMGSWLSDIED